jgi:hypothetical protein
MRKYPYNMIKVEPFEIALVKLDSPSNIGTGSCEALHTIKNPRSTISNNTMNLSIFLKSLSWFRMKEGLKEKF